MRITKFTGVCISLAFCSVVHAGGNDVILPADSVLLGEISRTVEPLKSNRMGVQIDLLSDQYNVLPPELDGCNLVGEIHIAVSDGVSRFMADKLNLNCKTKDGRLSRMPVKGYLFSPEDLAVGIRAGINMLSGNAELLAETKIKYVIEDPILHSTIGDE